MIRPIAAITVLVGVLAAALAVQAPMAAGPAPIQFGVAEDASKYAEDGGAAYFRTMADLGMVENRVTVFWDERDPTAIQEQGFLDRMMPVAAASGIRIVLSVYPLHAHAFATNTSDRIALFSGYVENLALRYPQVRDFVVGNEPNQRRFLQPQHAPDGAILSAQTYARVLAAAYDALKVLNPAIRVAGLATAPGGNDAPAGAGNESVSPVRFIEALGRAYRASGRTRPLMDYVDVHVYSAENPLPLIQRRQWPQAGPADLDRLKQAWWDAFHDTPQPLFEETGPTPGSGPFVRFRLDESGTQVTVAGSALYTGKENVPPVSEETQARYYADLVDLIKCDQDVSSLLLFHLIDEPLLLGFQSGLLRVDGSRRPSYAAVRSAVGRAGACANPHVWRHSLSVNRARASFELADRPIRQRRFTFLVRSGEEASIEAGIFRLTDGAPLAASAVRGVLGGSSAGALLRVSGRVKGNSGRRLVFHGRLEKGRYVFGVLLRATMNPDRTRLFVSDPFLVR